MFYDYAKIFVKGGNGGNGASAFRREKYVPMGGPAGGNGGKGQDIVLEAREGLRTLVDFKFKKHYKGTSGAHGQGSSKHGRNAEDMVLSVPLGTVVKDSETGEVLADMVEDGQRYVAAAGGRGGRGNACFVSSTHRSPTLAENGEPGRESWIVLELKLLADAGLVGFPNVGKSTLISRVSAAKPKIADYHFTTLVPNLGVVRMEAGRSFVLADIPGLIEGAAEGAGLGHRFLRHTERTRMLIHVLDISGSEGRDPCEDFEVIVGELAKYSEYLSKRPFIVAANKMDIPGAEENLKIFRDKYPDMEVFPVSAVTGEGVEKLMYRTAELVEKYEKAAAAEPEELSLKITKVERKKKPSISIERIDNTFIVTGPEIERHRAMTNIENEAAFRRFIQILNSMGLNELLEENGARDGDEVRVYDIMFEYYR